MSDDQAELQRLRALVDELVLGRFYGKHAGIVCEVEDPLQIGRVRARVPAVLGEDQPCGWALPSAAFGGGPERGLLCVPEIGDSVWIEFEAGDPSRPIWSGAFWGAPPGAGPEAPTVAGVGGPGHVILKTRAGHLLHIDDHGDEIVVRHADGRAQLRLASDGVVEIEATRIKLGAHASDALVRGEAFMRLFNAHTHPTDSGRSGPPSPAMSADELSSTSTVD